jgi:hypothetical protein
MRTGGKDGRTWEGRGGVGFARHSREPPGRLGLLRLPLNLLRSGLPLPLDTLARSRDTKDFAHLVSSDCNSLLPNFRSYHSETFCI